MKARLQKLSAKKIYFFLKTQEFRYHRYEIQLVSPLSLPNEVMKEVLKVFDKIYRPKTPYRATGATLAGLIPEKFVQKNLFSLDSENETPLLTTKNRGDLSSRWNEIFNAVDKLDRRYGTHTVVLGSSLEAFKARNIKPHRRLKILYMGEVV